MAGSYAAEIAILGGGVSGLWLLDLLRGAGRDALLFEREALGAGQTIASQGMVHGGVKYALGGAATPASETLAAMPGRWRDCLAGRCLPDLRELALASSDYCLFSDASLGSRLAAFFGSKLLRGRIERLEPAAFPPALRHPDFKGSVYRLADLVLDTAALLRLLGERNRDAIVMEAVSVKEGALVTAGGGRVEAARVLLAAGAGNEALIAQAGLRAKMQRRPLHQVAVTGKLPELHAHAVSATGGDKPRVTITSHRQGDRVTWHLGGSLAEEGVARSEQAQVEASRKLLTELLPWIDLAGCRFSCFRVDRAEPCQEDGHFADAPYVRQEGKFLVCWPVKLSLAPALGDKVLALLGIEAPSISGQAPAGSGPRPPARAAGDGKAQGQAAPAASAAGEAGAQPEAARGPGAGSCPPIAAAPWEQP